MLTDRKQVYLNYRCKKCNCYESKRVSDPGISQPPMYYYLTRKFHLCPAGIRDGERILAELVSITEDEPLGNLIN